VLLFILTCLLARLTSAQGIPEGLAPAESPVAASAYSPLMPGKVRAATGAATT